MISESSFSQSGYLSNDTICALATPLGGALAIVRVSGDQTLNILSQLVKKSADQMKDHKASLIKRYWLYDRQNKKLDDATVAIYKNPKSYTGEDSAEIFIHGNSLIARELLETLIHFGARLALPGEFSFRSVKNGKATLSQAQAVADLIQSSNFNALSLSLEKLSGSQHRLMNEIAEPLRQIAVLGEVGIDFSDQGIEELEINLLQKKVKPVLDALKKLAASFDRGLMIQEGVKTSILGLPNAGKSSLFNALLGRDRSIVSDQAGTTRDVVSETMSLGDFTLKFEDTAGLRHTDNQIESIGIERSLKSAQEAQLILLLVDLGNETQELESFLALLRQKKKQAQELMPPMILVFTKKDKHLEQVNNGNDGFLLKRFQELTQRFELKQKHWIFTSAKTEEGIDTLVQEIQFVLSQQLERKENEVVLTRFDHVQAILLAIEHLERGLETNELDLFSSDIRQSLNALSPILGETTPDDILGRIFSQFCIGK
jgi:tRNA modification GTPase